MDVGGKVVDQSSKKYSADWKLTIFNPHGANRLETAIIES